MPAPSSMYASRFPRTAGNPLRTIADRLGRLGPVH
jgi:hypothetical protein